MVQYNASTSECLSWCISEGVNYVMVTERLKHKTAPWLKVFLISPVSLQIDPSVSVVSASWLSEDFSSSYVIILRFCRI